ncbi:MAG: polyprenyl synthetase family protein [Acidobacteriota bacterium]
MKARAEGGGAFDRFAAASRPSLEEALARGLPPPVGRAAHLTLAIRDAVLSPGKRLRPLAALAAGELVGAPRESAMTVAVAVEFAHAASLVLDDLPSMDDARSRRGRPALHVVHGVATSELAAVALLARAFELVASAPGISGAARARILGELAGAVGASGCCAGQAADLTAQPTSTGLDDLEAIHAQKTGALFVAAVRGGALAGSGAERILSALTLYARNLGLAFQITDDLLDWEGDPKTMGKDVRRDAHRANFATILGPETSHRLVEELLQAASAALAPLRARAAVLAALARVVRDRRS